MAEIVLSAFLPVLFEKLGSAALKKMARSKGIHEQLEEWKRWLYEIRDVLSDAAEKEITQQAVKRWLNGLQHLAYDIDDVLDELATKAMHRDLTHESGASTSKVRKLIPTCCTSFSLSTRMNQKLKNIATKLQELEKQKNSLGLIVKEGKSKNMNRGLQTSLPEDVASIVGRQGDKEALLQKLLGDEPSNQNVSILPIVGLGGIGKTTLARLLYNETQVKDHFELKAWVCVSNEFDIFKITNIIFQSVMGGNKEFPDLNQLQVALKKSLSKKRFLLVLDDVWSESDGDWELLARPFIAGARGSKIIVTTRKAAVASAALQMGSVESYRLPILSEEDGLSLFAQQALGKSNFDDHPTLKSYGEGIVKKCNGLPLALIALGRLLRTKTNEEDWEELLNSEIWRLQNGNEIIPALRLSYHDLSAHLKQLFAYCSLFPKDYVFDKDELILLWMAEGFLHQSDASKSAESLGREYFEELLSRSFFQHLPNDESLYVMHDLMNDLARSVAGDFFFRLGYETKEDDRMKDLEKCRHMSFICEKDGGYEKLKEFEGAKSLRTLLVVSVGLEARWRRFYSSNETLLELLPRLPLLRVLRLSNHEISEVPESIGSLKHLRYLNLSRTGIKDLPEEVGNLYNLQTLLLCGCASLKKLPNSFSKLKNLRHLDISDTPFLEKMPLGIGKLKSLRTLSKVIIEGANGFAITDLKDLRDLHGRLSIEGLDKVKDTREAREANLLQKRLSELEMEWSEVFDGSRHEGLEKEVLNVLKPHNHSLKKLRMVSYGGIGFPSWVGDPSFFRLAHVTIRGCKKCTSLPPLGQLRELKELFVEGMDGVKAVGSEFLGTGCAGVAFPSLESLSFVDMKGLEKWSTNSGVTHAAFPLMRELRIALCHNLVEVSLGALPSLRVLDINACGDGVLRNLVHAASSVTELLITDISGLTQLQGGVINHLGAVEELSIHMCHEVRYLWESEAEACKILVNLRRLEVWDCSNLVRLGEKEEDNCGSSLTSLRQVTIFNCTRMEHFSCPNSIESLNISRCHSITCVSFPTGGQKKLKSILIHGREKLLVEEESGGGEKSRVPLNRSMLSLKFVSIFGLPNLKSLPDLSCFVHLTYLLISNCKDLELFPDDRLSTRTSLRPPAINDCPSMDDSFPGGLWPPNLRDLTIGGLKKPISKWAPWKFPTSLFSLRLEDDVGCSSGSQLSHLLPSSLKFLEISGFEKLESLSMGLQQLTSLQVLRISSCPNLRDLPETLLPLLLLLEISECPKLKKRCSRSGSYWPLISHILNIYIDGELCN